MVHELVLPTQVQDFVLHLAECPDVPVSPSLQPLSPACRGPTRQHDPLVNQPLLPVVWYHQTRWGYTLPHCLDQKWRCWTRLGSVLTPGHIANHWPPTRLYAIDNCLLSSAVQSVFNSPHCLLIQPTIHQLPLTSSFCLESISKRQYLLLSCHLFYHKSLSSWSNMTSPDWIHSDYSWWFSHPSMPGNVFQD